MFWNLCVSLMLSIPSMLWGFYLFSTIKTILTLDRLEEVEPLGIAALPSLSAIVPACNEAPHIEQMLRSLLGQSVAPQVVVVNDRSTDNTGGLLDALAATETRLEVCHIEHLPEGWLGKLNALEQGTKKATGDWLLYADADVQFASGALERAITYAEAHQVDFLTLLPKVGSAGFLGDIAMNFLCASIGFFGRLWELPDPKSPVIGGFGAFMMVRRVAFEKTEGFSWLKLEVADDMGLGMMLKQSGGRCQAAHAVSQLSLVWYDSYADILQKTQKNFFGIIGRFSLLRTWGVGALLFWMGCFPLGLLFPHSWSWLSWIAGAGMLTFLATELVSAAWLKRPLWASLLGPFGALLLAIVSFRAGWVGWRKGGIEWRGKLYPSEELRDVQRVRV